MNTKSLLIILLVTFATISIARDYRTTIRDTTFNSRNYSGGMYYISTLTNNQVTQWKNGDRAILTQSGYRTIYRYSSRGRGGFVLISSTPVSGGGGGGGDDEDNVRRPPESGEDNPCEGRTC